MISALSPLLEAITNYSFFKNAPIVPQGEQRLEKKDQYGMYTSELAKLLGQGVSQLPAVAGMDPKNSMFASPRIIDNTIKGYTAGLGQYAVNGVDALLKALSGNKGVPQPAQQWYEQPPVSGFLATTNGGGQVRQDFYDRWNELNQEKASAAKNQQPFQEQDYGRMKLADSAISQLMKQYKLIQNSQNYSPEAKRSLLDDLDAKMNQIAAMGLGKK